jgi:hypothetical protein
MLDKGSNVMPVSIRVFDPAMCCSSGVCGPSIDPQLARFAADLDALKASGVTVERFNLAQQPGAFVEHAVVKQALEALGEAALPVVLVDGAIKSTGTYPSREALAAWAGVAPAPAKAPCCGSQVAGPAPAKSTCC